MADGNDTSGDPAPDSITQSVVVVHDLSSTAKSYVYTRLAVLVVIAGLAVSIGLERWVRGVHLESISAYYFTPVHSLFVGALVALGAVMIALRSDDDLEDMLLNVAGALAPVVAFVPTARPTSMPTDAVVIVDADAFIRNNMIALLSALAAVVLTAFILASRAGGGSAIVPRHRSNWIGLMLSAALLVAGAVWYGVGRASFLRSAHGVSATVMFALIVIDVVANGWSRSRPIVWLRQIVNNSTYPSSNASSSPDRRRQYRWIAIWMVGGGVAAFGLGGRARVFWVEAVEIVGFAAFWVVQTASAVALAEADQRLLGSSAGSGRYDVGRG